MDAVMNEINSLSSRLHNLETNAESPLTLFQAAEDGDAAAILNLLKEGVDIRQRNEDGDSALHVAARAGHELAVMVLLEKCPVDLLGHLGSTPLHYASAEGHMSIVQRLLLAGANVNVKDTEGNFALLLAAKAGHLNVVELLANNGVSLDAVDKDGNPSLLAAAKAEMWDVVKLLLERGASADLYNDYESPLYLVVKHKQYTLIPLMLKQMERRESEMSDALIDTDIHDNEDDGFVPYVFEGVVPGFSRSQEARDAMTSLAGNGKVNMISAMLAIGTDVNGFNTQGHSCLGYAAWDGHVETLKLLLRRGASVNLVDRDGTALHYAAREERVECVNLLLESGASVHIKNRENKTAIDVAKSDEIRQILTSFS